VGIEPQTVRFCGVCRSVYHADFARCPNDGGPLEVRADDPLLGATVGHYEVEAFIGGGAMGRVYRCHHIHLQHKQFALKVLRGDLAAQMAMRLRFTQEAEAASRLVHPNVVSVTDFGRTDDGLLYLAMDLVEGETLGAIIERGPMPVARVVQLVKAMCEGLAHAHELGFVHRDFKPDNVIVVGDEPRIVDFGLAIHADPDSDAARLTTAGTAVGTPLYAAPEQAREGPVDHRADLFALGVTMFEMLAGTTPFEGSVLALLYLNAEGERPAIADRAPGVEVPVRLERLVRRLMAVSPEGRPASARSVIRELQIVELELEHPAAVVVIPSSPITEKIMRPRAPSSVWPRVAAAVAAVAVAAVVAFVAIGGADDSSVPATVSAAKPASEPARVAVPHEQPIDAAVAAVPDAEPPPERIADVPPPPPPPSHPHERTRHAKARGGKGDPHEVSDVAARQAVKADQGSAAEPRVATLDPLPHADRGSDAAADPTPRVADLGSDMPPTPRHVDPPPAPAHLATSARLGLEGMSVRGALTTGQVQRAVDRVVPAIRACYGPAVTKAQKSPNVSVRVRFEIDETEHARSIQTTATELPGLDTCVKRALGDLLAEAAPDVGTVDVTFVVKFVPEGA
jgi:serine/threonine-protein kinase